MRPFSHKPGVAVPYPLLQIICIVYPTKLKIIDWKDSQKVLMVLQFKFKTPCTGFTVFKDLVKQEVDIECQFDDNFAKFRLGYNEPEKHFALSLLRYKEEFLNYEVKRPHKIAVISKQLALKKPLVLFNNLDIDPVPKPEILFLGCHKKQEIEAVLERKDLCEFLPLWYLWGQFCLIKHTAKDTEGMLVFLKQLHDDINHKKHDALGPCLKTLLATGFAPMMVPYLEDYKHWGLALPKLTNASCSPWAVLGELFKLIRQFFILKKRQDLFILPHMPPELFSGKLIGVQEGGLEMDLEWTKKQIRRAVITAKKDADVCLHFQTGIKQFRLKEGHQDKGRIVKNFSTLSLKKKNIYFLDRFET